MGGTRFLSALLALFTLSIAIRPEQLDIQLNESLFYGTPKMVSYGTVVQIAGLSNWEDKHVLDMAFVAHQKFLTKYQEDIDSKKYRSPTLKPQDRPLVTTTMVVDNTAYISTSLKGKGSYVYDPVTPVIRENHPCEGPVLDGLRRCQERSIDVNGQTLAHRTKAKCGEYMAAFAFCIDTRQQGNLADARVVTIIRDDKKGENVVIAPCDKTNSKNHLPNDWGCTEFTQEVNMHVITEDAGREAKDVADGDIQQPSEQIKYP